MLPGPPEVNPSTAALFLDVDGTLLEIQEHPDDVRADDGLLEALSLLGQKFDGALALVSGRPIAELDRMFSSARIAVAGAHGAEIRTADGKVQIRTDSALAMSVVDAASRFAADNNLLVENKGSGFSLHYRRAPELEQTCRDFMNSLVADHSQDYRLIQGKMVLEMLPQSVNKGAAVEYFLSSAPFRGRRVIYAGDDTTDEDGFRVANKLSGVSIHVGDQKKTAARYGLEDVPAVQDWLRAIGGMN